MKDVNSDHIMANRKLDIYLSKLQLITQNLVVKKAILILHGDWHINLLHKKGGELDFYYE